MNAVPEKTAKVSQKMTQSFFSLRGVFLCALRVKCILLMC